MPINEINSYTFSYKEREIKLELQERELTTFVTESINIESIDFGNGLRLFSTGQLKENQWNHLKSNRKIISEDLVNIIAKPFIEEFQSVYTFNFNKDKRFFGSGELIVLANRKMSKEYVRTACNADEVKEESFDNYFLIKYETEKIARSEFKNIQDKDFDWIDYIEPNLSTYEEVFHEDGVFIPNLEKLADFKVQKAYELINADKVHRDNIRCDPKIKVALLDIGIDKNHRNLKKSFSHGRKGYDFMELCSKPQPYYKDAHGTLCAGIIGSQKDDNKSIDGIARGCRLYDYRIGHRSNDSARSFRTDIFRIIMAFHRARFVDDVHIINCSWDLSVPFNCLATMIQSVSKLDKNKPGSIVVCAAGNSSQTVGFPGDMNEVISVSAVTGEGKPKIKTGREDEWGSNFGDEKAKITIAAPGVKITTTDLTGINGATNFDYAFDFNGTSAAASFVSGCIALMLNINPNLDVEDVKGILGQSSREFKEEQKKYGPGILDIEGALKLV